MCQDEAVLEPGRSLRRYLGWACLVDRLYRAAERVSGPPEDRTPDPLIKSQLLYQAELAAHIARSAGDCTGSPVYLKGE